MGGLDRQALVPTTSGPTVRARVTRLEEVPVKKKLLMVLPLLLVAGVGYKMFLAPKPVPVKHKIEGTIQALQKDFLVNLADGQYAKVAIAVVLEEMPTAAAAEGATTVGLPQEPVVRANLTS